MVQMTSTSGNIALNANSGLVTTAAFQSTSAGLSYFTGRLNLEGDVKFTKANGLISGSANASTGSFGQVHAAR